MSNSRAGLKKAPSPRSGSRDTAFSVENPYKPGFLDPSTPESLRMSVDTELSAISNAFYQSAEVTSNVSDGISDTIDTIYGELDILAQEITRVEAETEAGFASIEEEMIILGDNDTLLAQQITTLEAETDAAFASVNQELTVLADADLALSQALTELEVEFDNNMASISSELTALADADQALSQSITTLDAETDAGFASVNSQLTALSNTDQSLSQQITNLDAEMDGNIASINSELTALASADAAMSQRIDSLTASTDAGFASIDSEMSVLSSEVDGLQAKWSITADVNGKISGIELTNDGIYSEFIVMADRFAVTDGTDTSEPPFEVVNGSTRIKSAYVNTLQSDNWDGGTTGWFISNAGDANFNNVTVRGTINADSSFKGVGASGNRISQNGISFSTSATEFATLTVSEALQEEAILIIQGFLNLDNGTDLKVGLRRNGNIVSDCTLFGVRDGAPVSWLLTEDLPKGFSGTLGIETLQVNGSWSSSSFSPGFWFLVRKV